LETIRVIDRALDVIELLSDSQNPMTLTELSNASGLSKSTLHRLLSVLTERQYIEKRADGTYTIGYKMIEAVSNHINGLELLTEAKPFLTEVSRELGLNTHLGILDEGQVVYIEKSDNQSDIQKYTSVGCHSPAYCSSIGKCLMACLSGDELDELLYRVKFVQYTQNTITDQKEFRRMLRVIRKQGWAMDNEEYQKGHRCVGAPIFDYRGTAIAAFSVSASDYMLRDEDLEKVIGKVKKTAAEISRRMGYVE